MGLDNYISVKRTTHSNKIQELKRFEDDWDKEHKYDFDVCYWRKCWNARGAIIGSIDGGFYDNGITPLTKDDVKRIIVALKEFNEDNWDDGLGSIWTWEEHEPHMQQNIENLEYLLTLMDKYDLEVEFVDSY